MTKASTLCEMAQFTGILRTSGLDPRCIKQATGNVPKLIEAFEAQPENRAGRRVRKPVRQAVRRMLAHLTSAARHVGDGSVSRREARRLIRFAGCCDDFAELQRRASQYRGRHNKMVRGINDRKARERAREIWLDDDHSLLEVKTLSQLRSVGKRLRNCIGSQLGGDYRDALRGGESEFWALRCQGECVGLLTIDIESRKIEECAGVDNEPVGWGRRLLLELQRALNAAGDEIEEFVESGAFSLFAHQPNLRPVRVQVGLLICQIWSSSGELIVCDDRKRWSRFKLALGRRREFPACEATYGSALDSEELLCMVATTSELAAVIARSLPERDAGEANPPPSRRRCRPRRRRRG
ncbi:MAG: hypothetical protein OXJ53_04705 [Gammaproteobacteria bacterium]|nr:hypothetical protein [Gammaproteobacteria bacterium]MDE0269678.1 hypothetical protein [Gammaproteobacteria bacterium]